MSSNSKNLRFVWLALYTILIFFVGGRWNISLAAWVAPVFAIRFYRDSDRAWRAFLLLWIATTVPTVIAWNGATAMPLFHPAAETIFFTLTTPVGLIPYVLDRLYARRFAPSLWLTLVFPVAFTALDFFAATGSPFGSFGAGAYAQRDVTWLMQLTAVTGLWGVVFVVSWFASVANFVWEQGLQWRKISRVVLVYAGAFVLVAGFGFGRLLLAQPAAQTAQIAGFSLPAGQVNGLMAQVNSGDKAGFQAATQQLHAGQLARIREAAQAGAQIVLLQEGAGIGFTDDVARLLADAAAMAREEAIYIVLPTFAVDPAGQVQPENVARIIDPTGAVVLEHTKFGGSLFEGSRTGSGVLQTVNTPFGKLSAIICWDADFPDVIRQAGAQDVDLLFIPANDWYELRDIHAGMATFRAVENGMAIFRQTGAGVSLVADAYGRIVSRVDSFGAEQTGDITDLQQVMTPIEAVNTIYPLVGDAFGWAMQIGLVGLVALLWVKRRGAR